MHIAASRSELARIKAVIDRGLPGLKRSHLVDAMVKSIGFKDFDAYTAWDESRPRNESMLRKCEPDIIFDRLADLGHKFRPMDDMMLFMAFNAAGAELGGRSMSELHARESRIQEAVRNGRPSSAHFGGPYDRDSYVGGLAQSLHDRITGGGGFLEFTREALSSNDEKRGPGLFDSISRASALDPQMAGFLLDSLAAASLSHRTGSTFPAWRDAAYAAYAPRIHVFLDTMCRQSPTLSSTSGEVGRADWFVPPYEQASPEIDLGTGVSKAAGLFDAGRTTADVSTVVGIGAMALWRAGTPSEEITEFMDEAADNPAAAFTHFFEGCHDQPEALRDLLGAQETERPRFH